MLTNNDQYPKNIKKLFTYITRLFILLLFFLIPSYGAMKYAPIIMDDIITFVPYTEVSVSLGEDKTWGEDEPQTVSATIEHSEQVASYAWSEGGTVLGTGSTLSTAGLSVGIHTITLTVTDVNGLTSSDTIVITIEDRIDESDLNEDTRFVGTTKGEFSVNQGTANYSLKIDVPPGVAGMEPKLSLNYSSNGGNGYLGVGWSLGGVSAITRCPQSRAVDGVYHAFGVNYNNNDRFCLDGQRLIVVNGLPYGADGAEYRTEIDSYSKVIAHGNSNGAGDPWFEVKTKSGLIYRYGNAHNAAQKTPNNAVTKFWKVSSIKDSYNNTINFFYSSIPIIGEHYLTWVTYADNSVKFDYEMRDDVLKGYHAGYPFRISERLKTVTVKNGSTEVRRYLIEYANDLTGSTRSAIRSITEHLPKEGDLKTLHFSTGGTFENSQFNYTNGTNTNIPVDGSNNYPYIYTPDMNGDGLSDICYRDDTGMKCFINHNGTFNTVAEIDTTICSNSHSGCSSPNNWDTIRFTDMNADGLADLVYRSDDGMRIWKSTGEGLSFLAGNTILANGTDSSSDNNLRYIYTPDTNGDGLSDLCYRRDNGIHCYVNQGDASFSTTPSISTSICANGSTDYGSCNDENNWDTIRFVDMDADGLQDLVYRSDEGMRIWKSTGSGFGSTPSYSSDLVKNVPLESNNFNFNSIRDEWKYIYTPDMNGDGLPDLCYRSYEGIKCYTNYGGGFFTTPSIDTAICAKDSHEDGTCNDADNYETIRFVDTDADGLVDLTYRSDEGMRIWTNRGNTLAQTPKTSTILANYQDSFGYNDHDNWSTKGYFDLNGDGIQDLYYRSDSGIVVYTNRSRHALVQSINNFTDQSIKIAYKPLTDTTVYYNYSTHGKRNSYAFNKLSNGNIEISPAIPVVASVKSLNGLGETIYDDDGYNTIRYKYFGYILNKLRGSQGFHAINTYDDTAGMYRTVSYKQIGVKSGSEDTEGFQFTGMPYAVYDQREYGVDTPLSRTSITYKDASVRSGIYEPYTYSNIQTTYDLDTKDPLQSVYHYNTLSSNGLGNVLTSRDKTVDIVNGTQQQKVTTNSYDAEETSAWHIGRLTSATVVHSETGTSNISKSSTFAYNAKGVLSKEVANAGTPLALTKTYTYDSHGNKKTQTISGSGITTATTTYGYDTLGKFQTSIKDAAGYTLTKTYDARFGTVKSLTDANGLKTTWEYDGLGRKIEEIRADGTKTVWRHTYGSNYISAPHARYSVSVSSRAVPFSRTYYDSLGREVGSYTYTMKKGSRTSYASRRIVKRKYYNAKGELTKEELPHYQGESAGEIRTNYDRYGRVTSVIKTGANNTAQTYLMGYDNFTQTVNNPNNQTKRTVKNAFGQVVSVTDAYGSNEASTISYTYDATGNLLSTTDSAGNVISMEYDSAGNKIKMIDPDLGEWHYSYNALGKLKLQWSGSEGYSNSKHASYKNYDILGRVTRDMSYNRQEYNSNSHTFSYNQTNYVYGGTGASLGSRGKLLRTTASSRVLGEAAKTETVNVSYDRLGRPIQSITNISGRGEYTRTTTYDRLSRSSRITYPNGYYVTNHYKNGLLDAVIGKEGKVHYVVNGLNAFGEAESVRYANGVQSFMGYDSAGYLGTIVSGLGTAISGSVQRLDYSYDGLGNVLTREDNSIAGKNITETFGYDSMNRLTSINTSSDVQGAYAKSKTYSYNSLGNITYQSGIGSYTYYADKPHALKSAGSRNYTYDAVGNTVNRNGDTITYNPLNKPATLTNHTNNKTVTFTYGAGGQRYQKQTSDGKFTYYIGKSYEEQVEENTEKQICYISLGGKTIGTHIEVKDTDYDTGNPHYNEATYNRYFHTDALGSITAITNDSGTVVERRSYTPFGKIRAMDYGTNNNSIANTTLQTTRAFTGHEQIAELSGLIHMNARVYDSDIGRFLSADTVIQDPHDSQSYNRYSYVRNNPLKYTDPTGNSWWTKFRDKWLKPIVSIVVSAVIVFATGGSALGIFAAGATSGGIMTGTWQGAFKGGLFALFSAGIAQGIGNGFESTFGLEHGATLFSSAKYGAQILRAASHGISRAIINMAQGGMFKSGFTSGFVASLFSPGTELGGDGTGGFTLRTTIAGVVGGTASEIGGGKFSNGAVSGAFVHMFNAEGAVKLFVKHIHSFFRSKVSVLLDDAILDTAKASRSADTLIYTKNGTFDTAIREFESLAVDSSIKIHKNGTLRTGVMENGEKISVRNFSSGNDITLQMSNGGNHIKIRYSGLSRLPDDSIEAGFLFF